MDSSASAADQNRSDRVNGKSQETAREDDPWTLYDKLIADIPGGIEVTDFCVGAHWCYIEATCGMGLSHAVIGGARGGLKRDPRDFDLHGLAELSKSWSFLDASLGVAALNAWYCSPERVRSLGGTIDAGVVESHDASNPLHGLLRQQWAGKLVTVIGHFPGVEQMAREAQVTVLERDCRDALDIPDSACEFILPKQDFVLMTGTTLTNKTAPRLLALARTATTVMVGPSAVPAPALLEHGVDIIAGSVVVDPESAKFAVKGGSKQDWRRGIKKFSIEKG